MEHIQEIRSLRKRLEESIKTNEKLRRQLERQGPELDPGEGDRPKGGAGLRLGRRRVGRRRVGLRLGKNSGLGAGGISVQILTLLPLSKVTALTLLTLSYRHLSLQWDK